MTDMPIITGAPYVAPDPVTGAKVDGLVSARRQLTDTQARLAAELNRQVSFLDGALYALGAAIDPSGALVALVTALDGAAVPPSPAPPADPSPNVDPHLVPPVEVDPALTDQAAADLADVDPAQLPPHLAPLAGAPADPSTGDTSSDTPTAPDLSTLPPPPAEPSPGPSSDDSWLPAPGEPPATIAPAEPASDGHPTT